MDAAATLQNRFQDSLAALLNGRLPSRAARALALLAPASAVGQVAPELATRYGKLRAILAEQTLASPWESLPVPAYTDGHPQVQAIMAGLLPIAPWLAGACVHGSLADGTQVAYSDFDGLVILRHEAFAHPDRLRGICMTLRGLERPMLALDPLQHHGWFVLTEADLAWHCEAYFPAALFRHARWLLPGDGEVRLRRRDSRAETRAAFVGLAEAVRRKASRSAPATDMYALKSLLSQFMLLPALYLQARDGHGVYKRDSFALARPDFAPALWAPMDEVSAIRRDWHYDLEPWRRALLTRWPAGRRLTTRACPPPIPAAIRARLTPSLWAGMARLAGTMGERAGAA